MLLVFKTKKQKIETLEDAITDKEARLRVLTAMHEGAKEISYFHLDKIEDLTAEIAVLRNKLGRVKGMSSNVEVSGLRGFLRRSARLTGWATSSLRLCGDLRFWWFFQFPNALLFQRPMMRV